MSVSDHNTYVTVGIPFYAGTKAEHFRLAFDSILSQSLRPYEVHLIQDGPISSELETLVTAFTSYDCVTHLIIPQNVGLSYALNLSILHTSTPYYARMDADDVSHSTRLEKQANFLLENQAIDILGTWVLEFKHDPLYEEGFLRKLPTDLSQIRAFFHYRNPIAHPSVMFRRGVFARIGLYDLRFSGAEDLELWARALRMNIGIANLPEVLLYYRMSGVVDRHSSLDRVVRQARARYRYNTWSPKLNLLKIMALLFRLAPYPVREWGYRNLR
jgi:glycosyltransferase involved in cell wall biosynthesis